MLGIKRRKVLAFERGFLFKNGELTKILTKGRYSFVDLKNELKISKLSMRNTWIEHDNLDIIIKSGLVDKEIEVIDLKDTERALVWIDGRFDKILKPGLYALWNTCNDIRIEILDVESFRFVHKDFNTILKSNGVDEVLELMTIPEKYQGILYKDGNFYANLSPGRYAFYKGAGETKLYLIDKREISIDVSGQEIMTKDKVTLRCNAILSYTINDDRKAVELTKDLKQTLYRETQLILRAIIGGLILDDLLIKKEEVAEDIKRLMKERVKDYGAVVTGAGIKDIILPGEMKELMNKVIEAEKKAKANLIYRREETAAMRSQANTARLLDNNPTLMRLRELEILEKLAVNSKLNLVLGEKGLSDRVVNLL